MSHHIQAANQSHFEFLLPQWPEDTFIVQKFHSENYALSQAYSIIVNVLTAYTIPVTNMLNHAAKLLLQWPPDIVYLHGLIDQVKYLGPSLDGQQHVYEIALISPIKNLLRSQHTQIFLQKTVIDIAQEILTNAGWLATAFRIQTRNNYPQRPLTIQYNETDLTFLERLLNEYGLIYWVEQTPEAPILWILDHIQDLPAFPDEALPFREESGSPHFSGSVAIFLDNANWQTRSMSTQGFTADHNYDQLTQAQSTNTTEITAWGEYLEFGLSFESKISAQQRVQIGQQALDVQRQSFTLITDCPGLQLGQSFALTHHEIHDFNNHYRVIALLLQGDQSSALNLADAQQEKFTKTYTANIIAIPANISYHAPLKSRASFHHLLAATVEALSGNLPYLDAHGRYHVRFAFDQSNSPVGQASPPLPLLQPYGGPISIDGQAQGIHFALRPSTQVAVGFLHGDLDQPVILGTLHHPSNPSTVNSNNPSQHCIRTASGQEFLIDDKTGQSYLMLATANHQNRIELNAPDDQHSVNLISELGEIKAYAKRKLTIATQQDHVRQSNNGILTSAQQDHFTITQEGAISQKASDQIQMQANRHLQLQAQHDAAFQAEKNWQLNSGTSVSVQVQQGNLLMQAPQGNVKLQAQNNIAIHGNDQGEILIGQPSGGIVISQAGNLHITGEQIHLEAPEITAHGIATINTTSPITYNPPPEISVK